MGHLMLRAALKTGIVNLDEVFMREGRKLIQEAITQDIKTD